MSDTVLSAAPILDRFRLEGRVALVTGAGQGIGRGYAHALGEAGASVAVVDLDRELASQVVDELADKNIDALAISADVTVEEDIQRMIDSVLGRWGRLTIAVNNAGMADWTAAEDVSEENWDKINDLNLKGVFRCAQAEARWGTRLGQGSVAGWNVTRAFVTSSLIFCVGPMTILGSIQDGLLGDYDLLAVKSALDGFAAIPFAASLGPGVLLSVGTVAVVQGGLSAAAMAVGGGLGDVSRQTPWVIELTATGGVVILGIGLSLLEVKRIRVANLLPSIAIAPLIVWVQAIAGAGV